MTVGRFSVLVLALAAACSVVPPAAAQRYAEPIDRFAPGAYQPPTRWRGGPDPWTQAPMQVDDVEVLYVDDLPLPLAHYQPAGGPLQRHMSRPGAWYAAVFVPMTPSLPVQLWVWQRMRTHELRVFALDAPPTGLPSVVAPIPLRTAVGGRPVLQSAPIALPAASSADGVFVLLEQWSVAGDRPEALQLQARSRVFRDPEPTPWWSTRAGAGPNTLPADAPPSPLATPRNLDHLLELPIQRRLGAAPVHERGLER